MCDPQSHRVRLKSLLVRTGLSRIGNPTGTLNLHTRFVGCRPGQTVPTLVVSAAASLSDNTLPSFLGATNDYDVGFALDVSGRALLAGGAEEQNNSIAAKPVLAPS